MMSQLEWLANLGDSVGEFMSTLQVPDQPGRFLPCVSGLTTVGEQVNLGFSCYALKIYYTLGLWEKLDCQEHTTWISFLKSFQVGEDYSKDQVCKNAFVDRLVFNYLNKQVPWYTRLTQRFIYPRNLTYLQQIIIAETKQAISTLSQVGEESKEPYHGFPKTEEGVHNYLALLDWANPWDAGGQASALAVFLKLQAPRCMLIEEVQQLLNVYIRFIENVADNETGAYFKGTVPDYGKLINGAMKILTALDWLEVPIHYPERLIDTCLRRLPQSDGCHLVDAIYVIYRCLHQTKYDRKTLEDYCMKVLEMIVRHYNQDGGFSYSIGKSQTHYYGVQISQGHSVSDIHGTCLLTWAIAMLSDILNDTALNWRIIKP